jgi:hypothetical protein
MKNININEKTAQFVSRHIKEHRMGMNVTTALQHLRRRVELLGHALLIV